MEKILINEERITFDTIIEKKGYNNAEKKYQTHNNRFF